MSTEYSDHPTPARTPAPSHLPPLIPRCRCGQLPRMHKGAAGYIVQCSDPYCPLEEMPLADNEATPTKASAWQFWAWKRTGRLQ